MKKILLLLSLMLMLLPGCVEEPIPNPNTWQGNFDALWNTIDRRYCYLDYKEVDWDSIKVLYQQKLPLITNEQNFFSLMSRMLEELKDGHVNLYSDFNISRYWKWFEDYPTNFRPELIYSLRYLGNDYQIAGGMHYGKIDGGRIGYIYYGDFTATFSTNNLKRILDSFSECQGLIIDVRNNGGGYLSSAETLASCFFEKRTLTGYMSHKTGFGRSDFSKPVAIYTENKDSVHWFKPVAVLTNRMSYSATNVFASRMRYAPHAVLVGDKTGGGGGLPMTNELPNGWLVRFSACPMYDASMQHIEWGLDPDVKVDVDTDDAIKGYDSIIEKAILLLNGDQASTPSKNFKP
jgi:hypothetical protein